MKIGAILQELLQEKNIKPAELSRVINVPASTIYSIIKRDNMKVDIDILIKISDALGVPAEYFYDKRTTNKSNDFSLDEIELIKKYRLLTDEQQGAVNANINYFIESNKQKNEENLNQSENKVG